MLSTRVFHKKLPLKDVESRRKFIVLILSTSRSFLSYAPKVFTTIVIVIRHYYRFSLLLLLALDFIFYMFVVKWRALCKAAVAEGSPSLNIFNTNNNDKNVC